MQPLPTEAVQAVQPVLTESQMWFYLIIMFAGLFIKDIGWRWHRRRSRSREAEAHAQASIQEGMKNGFKKALKETVEEAIDTKLANMVTTDRCEANRRTVVKDAIERDERHHKRLECQIQSNEDRLFRVASKQAVPL